MSSNRSASLNKFKVVLGYILLFISIILFSSFISYMFNWKVDQSNVNSLFDRDVEVKNILGKVGASISHFFIFKLFGIGSFVIPIILFISSYFILFNKKISLELPAPKPDIVLGRSRIEEANMTGITPAVLIFRGKCEL